MRVYIWRMKRDTEPSGACARREALLDMARGLNAEDRAWLRRRLLGDISHALVRDEGRLSRHELNEAENWLWDRVSQARSARERRPRIRIWLVFMLLRHGALRLSEAVSLAPLDVAADGSFVAVRGPRAREVPLSPAVGRRLRAVINDPQFFAGGEKMLAVDAGYVRRCFQQCGAACGFRAGMLTARALRRSRAEELLAQGLPLPVVDFFLGRNALAHESAMLPRDAELSRRLLREQVLLEHPMPTSARNAFPGRVTGLRAFGLLVEVTIATAGGLVLAAIITDRSSRRLALAPGKLVIASVKAPWVVVGPRNSHPDSYAEPSAVVPDGLTDSSAAVARGGVNAYPAVVDAVRSDASVTEILATLPDGSQVCALQGAARPRPRAGDRVAVRFGAFCVIVNLDAP